MGCANIAITYLMTGNHDKALEFTYEEMEIIKRSNGSISDENYAYCL